MTDSLYFFCTFETSKFVMEKALLKGYQKAILAGLFLVFLLVATFSYNDYGIAWDEPSQMEIGQLNYEFVTAENDSLKTYHDRFYGAAYEMPIYALIQALDIQTDLAQYNFRHLINHLLFIISLGFFFALIFKLFKSFNAAILGVIMLYIHPRIFAHSFFNSKDMIFLSLFIIGLYTLYFLIQKQSNKRIILHAVVTALLIDVRILGIVLPFISLLVVLPTLFRSNEERGQLLKTMAKYSILLIVFIYAFWPALWTDPLLLGKSFIRMSHFPFRYDVLFQGNLIPAKQIPWTYIPVWFGVTTPPFILLLSLIGFIWLIRDYLKNPESAFNSNKQWFILVIASFPIDFSILLMIMNSTLYDGWRQVFFLYPMILIAAIYAFHKIGIKLKVKPMGQKVVYGLITVFILLTVLKIYKLHPYEQVYFNHFVSKKEENRKKSFDMDYWGLGYRAGLEYIIENDSSKLIRINFGNAAGPNNILCLSAENQKRIIVVEQAESADYFITNYRYHPQDYDYKNEVFNIEKDKNRILSVFKLNN